jgi:protein TilB
MFELKTRSAWQALNNISKIEGLDRNEKLRKLDLTVNFIDVDSLLSVESLRVNLNLEELYLLGNPCAEFDGYRLFVVGTLPQLKRLDGQVITATERIRAAQELSAIRARLVIAARDRVRARGGDPALVDAPPPPRIPGDGSDDEDLEMYGWSPEIRVADYRREERRKEKEEREKKQHERERDPYKAMMDDMAANRELIKPGNRNCMRVGRWLA